VAIHYVSGDADPLFQTDKFSATQTFNNCIVGASACRRLARSPAFAFTAANWRTGSVCVALNLSVWNGGSEGESRRSG
jgi:hypothetical protein